MLALATLALTLGYTLPTGPRRAGAVAHVADRSHGVYMGVYERLYCEDEYNAKKKTVEEVCTVPPYAANVRDMRSGSCELLGDYPAPGAGTRWACTEKMGANSEEECTRLSSGLCVGGCAVHPRVVLGSRLGFAGVNGKLLWVHYVRAA